MSGNGSAEETGKTDEYAQVRRVAYFATILIGAIGIVVLDILLRRFTGKNGLSSLGWGMVLCFLIVAGLEVYRSLWRTFDIKLFRIAAAVTWSFGVGYDMAIFVQFYRYNISSIRVVNSEHDFVFYVLGFIVPQLPLAWAVVRFVESRIALDSHLEHDVLGADSKCIREARKRGPIDSRYQYYLLRARLIHALHRAEETAINNLTVGLVVASIGLCVLVYGFLEVDTERSYFAPNVVSGFALELLAMFFLRLYRQGLNDSKYYQNELTNVESRWMAYVSSLVVKRNATADITEFVLKKLATTERNFILKEGESTVGLEGEKVGSGDA